MSEMHPMYVCGDCGYARYHHLIYCPKCPGKLTKKDIPHPTNFKTKTEHVEWLTQQGLDYSWDECATAPCKVLVERFNNLKELESFCLRMSLRSDWKLTPEGRKWHEYVETVRDAIKKMTFIIAKVSVPQGVMDESWSVFRPFWNVERTEEAVRRKMGE